MQLLIEIQGRILRYLASVGMLKESSKDTYSANNITRVLSDENYQAGIYHWSVSFRSLSSPLPFLLRSYASETQTNAIRSSSTASRTLAR